MDLNNNKVGLDVYKNSFLSSMQSLYEKIIDAAADGKLQIYDKSTKTRSNFKLTKKEVKALKEIKINP